MIYMHFWSKTPGKAAQAGGYVRCDSLKEAIANGVNARRMGLAIQWRFS